MAHEPPTPPIELPTDIVDTLNGYTPDQLQHVVRYAEALATHKERTVRRKEGLDDDEIEELPDDVPSKATITVKEINDNRYYYWQWRDGETIRSQYKGPVSPDE